MSPRRRILLRLPPLSLNELAIVSSVFETISVHLDDIFTEAIECDPQADSESEHDAHDVDPPHPDIITEPKFHDF